MIFKKKLLTYGKISFYFKKKIVYTHIEKKNWVQHKLAKMITLISSFNQKKKVCQLTKKIHCKKIEFLQSYV